MLKKKNVYLIPIIGFLIIIFIGAILLTLPISNNKPIQFIDSLFMATSGICVNGFMTVNIVEQYNLLGQVILAVITEIGALGLMSFIVFIIAVKNKKVKLSDTLIAGDTINENVYANIKDRLKHIFKYTFIIELIGAILLAIKFIPMYGFCKGAWYSIFHSITAFCNTSFDLFGNTSLSCFKNDIYINIIFMGLIILGSIGFFVIEDLSINRKSRNKIKIQTKIVLFTTAILLTIGTLIICIFEPKMNFMNSAFLSVTLRTAGFYTIDITNLNIQTRIICLILMFIGGAPGSTSGGIKVVVFAVLILTIVATLKNRKEVVVFYRKINAELIRKAITITILSLLAIFIAVIALLYFNDFGIENIVFHCVSAFSATGLGLIESSTLNIYGKIIIMILMFIGRIGPISAISLFIIDKKERDEINYADGNLML